MVERNRISGVQELRRKLNNAKRDLGRPLARRIARQGAAITRDEARRIAPFQDRTGEGRKGIISWEKRSYGTEDASATVGFRRGGQRTTKKGLQKIASAFYLAFIEGGTQPHTINTTGAFIARYGPNKGTQQRKGKLKLRQLRNPKKMLEIRFSGGLVLYRRSVEHPGITARPFLVQALRNSEGAILRNSEQLYNDAIQRVCDGRPAAQ